MNSGNQFDVVIKAYKTHSHEFGFIPKSSLYNRYYLTGNIKFIGNSFIIIGPQRREKVRIYALYVSPDDRRTKVVHELLDLVPPNKIYYVRCTESGVSFWKYHGMKMVSVSNNNSRHRNIYHLEGYLK